MDNSSKTAGSEIIIFFLSIFLILCDSYLNSYIFLIEINKTISFLDELVLNLYSFKVISDYGLNTRILLLIAIFLLSLGVKPKKKITLNSKRLFVTAFIGTTLFFAPVILKYQGALYILSPLLGFFILGYVSITIQKYIKGKHMKDRFDIEAREFEQNEELIENEYSVNLPFKYNYKGKKRNGWINIVNPFRAVLVTGIPGSGKTYASLEEAIRQLAKKGFALGVYDYKYPDLTQATFSYVNEYFDNYDISPSFHVINLDNPRLSNRCNPLQPELLTDFTDAMESATSIMLGMNRTWIKKQGDFFVESPINLVSCGIWALKLAHESLDEQYCTFPHLIELLSLDYDTMFGCLTAFDDTSISNIMSPFLSAWETKTMEQLEGQIASVRLGLSRLTSEPVYWATTGNDFSLDINNPKQPKVVCFANNSERQMIYGVVLSLYASRMIRLINKKGKRKTGLFFDELPTIFLGTNTLDNLIATGRSNLIATFIGIQDFAQTFRDYGKEVAEAIINICGNVLTGMAGSQTAKAFSEKIGKIKVRRQSVNISKSDTSVNFSETMEPIAPVDVLSKLSQGELAGIVADNYDQQISMDKKAFIGMVDINPKLKKITKKHKLPDMTVIPENIDVDELLTQNMENIKQSIKKLSVILNFKIDFNDITKRDIVKSNIDKFITISRKKKKEKIISIFKEKGYDDLLEELTSKYVEVANYIIESEDDDRTSPAEVNKILDKLNIYIRKEISEKVDELSMTEKIDIE